MAQPERGTRLQVCLETSVTSCLLPSLRAVAVAVLGQPMPLEPAVQVAVAAITRLARPGHRVKGTVEATEQAFLAAVVAVLLALAATDLAITAGTAVPGLRPTALGAQQHQLGKTWGERVSTQEAVVVAGKRVAIRQERAVAAGVVTARPQLRLQTETDRPIQEAVAVGSRSTIKLLGVAVRESSL